MKPAPQAPLSAVEWRVDGKPNDKSPPSVRYVPYLDARLMAELLDEWVGPENWTDSYEPLVVDGKFSLLCSLAIFDGERWVSKQDVGVPSNFESQKGCVSDAFKRAACLKWGVGRNVYDLPTLWAPCRIGTDQKAYPNDDTLPSIQRQLKARGYEADGGTVKEPDPERDEPTSDGPPPAVGGVPTCPLCDKSLATGSLTFKDGMKVHKACAGADPKYDPKPGEEPF